MALTDDEQRRILAWADRGLFVLDRERAKVLTNEDLPAIADAILNREVEWYGFDGKTQPAGQRHTTSQALALGWADATATSLASLLNNIPANVLNQSFSLPDGTKTNLAGLLAQINAKPAAVTNVTSTAPAPGIDVDGLVARLKAELPAAVLAELTTKLTK